MKIIVLFLVASVFLGAELLAVPLGFAQLSLYRLTIVFSLLLFIKDSVIEKADTQVSINDNLNYYHFVYFSWTLYAILSFLWVESYSRWVFGVFFVSFGTIAIFLISFYMKNLTDVKRLFTIVFVMSSLHQLVGWYEILTLNYIWRTSRHGRAITTFGNINDYATFLLAGMFIGLLMLLTSKRIIVKLYATVHMGSGLYLLIHSVSRGNQLGLLLGISAIILLLLFDINWFRKALFAVVLASSSLMISIILVPGVRSRTLELIKSGIERIFQEGSSNLYRINLIRNGLNFFVQSFGLGVGAGNVEYWMINKPVITEIDAPNLHNWFLEILVGYGLLIFTLYVIMYVFTLRQLYLSFRYSSDLYIKKSSLVLFAYLIAFLASSISSASNIFIEWQWVFWGVIIAFVQITQKQRYHHTPLEEAIRQ